MLCRSACATLRAGGARDNGEARGDDSGVGALIEKHRAQALGSQAVSMSAPETVQLIFECLCADSAVVQAYQVIKLLRENCTPIGVQNSLPYGNTGSCVARLLGDAGPE